MLSIKNPKIDYDSTYDVLYVRQNDSTNVYGDEEPDNLVFFRDLDTDEFVGITIMDYLHMLKTGDSRLSSVPANIDLSAINKSLNLRA